VWSVSALGVKDESGLTDVVKDAVAVLTADDGAGEQAALPFDIRMGPADPGDFIPFASLTLVDVVGWIEDEMGLGLPKAKAFLDGVLANRVDATEVAPPWV
jgi:hypothetical protein